MIFRPALLALLVSFCAAPLHAQRGDRASEVQLPPPAYIKIPPAPAFDDETLAGVLTLRPPLLGPYRRAAVATRDEPWSDKELAELQRTFAPPRRAKPLEVGGQ